MARPLPTARGTESAWKFTKSIHEKPLIGSKDTTRLEEGMVFTVEPGIYLEGKGGVRIEDMVLVTNGGCRVLTKRPKSLTVIFDA
ncbi:MAG: hypothetical protein DSY91_07390 [Deltaproteobacteria bacterium]|nr:MAG: hypothetical protein DSY91_07390 [Deltaproteobacteria bacterium]